MEKGYKNSFAKFILLRKRFFTVNIPVFVIIPYQDVNVKTKNNNFYKILQ